MAAKSRCPKCNHPNEQGAPQCASCNAPLVQRCPVCGTMRPWYVPRCARCDVGAADASTFVDLFRPAIERALRGRYQLGEALTSGRVTTVYRASDTHHPQMTCAIKEISPLALFRADERREAERQLWASVERWAEIDHPGVVRVRDWFVERERYYIVFEWAPGWSGERLITEAQLRVTPDLARNWGAQLADILAHLHSQEPPRYAPFLAPGHIMIGPGGEVKLIGLGLGRFFDPTGYGPFGSVRGYAAPELDASAPSAASDCFALGRVLYALLIKHSLEKGLPRQLPLKQAAPGISEQLVKAIARAAHRDATRRYATMIDLRDALWEPPMGALAPVPDWHARISAISIAQAVEMPSRPTGGPQASMEDMGFAPDPRFGPRRTQLPPDPALQPPDAPVAAPGLSIYPREFRVTDLQANESRRLVLRLRNTGNAEMAGSVMSHVGWVRAPKQGFRIPAGKQAQVIITVKADLPASGRVHEPRALSVETDAGRQWIGIEAEMRVGPLLAVEATALDWGIFETDGQRSLDLPLRNGGRQVLVGQAASRVEWLRLSPSSFRCPPGDTITLRATVDAGRLPRGRQNVADAIAIDSDGGQARLAAQAWRTRAELDLGASHIDLGILAASEVAERYLLVGNTGDGLLTGSIRTLAPWLSVFPQEIRVQPGDLVQHTITADSIDLGDGIHDVGQALRVQTNGGTATLSLRAQVRAPLMVVETMALDFGISPLGQPATRTITLRNDGSAPYQATIIPLVNWLIPERSHVACAAHGSVSVAVRLDETAFNQGQRLAVPAALAIEAEGRRVEIGASVIVQQPALRVEPEEIDFGYILPSEPAIRALIVANDGTGPLAWTIQTDAQWIEVQPRSGLCQPGESVTLRLAAYALALEAGVSVAQNTLAITSDGGRAKVPLRIGIAAPLLSTDSPLLDLGNSRNMRPVSGAFRVFNRGLGPLRGTLACDKLWLVTDRVSFECDMGRSIEIGVRVDMDEFPRGVTHDTALVAIESNGGAGQIEVMLGIEFAPEVEVPERLILESPAGEIAPQGRLTLHNIGLAAARVELDADDPAILISRQVVDIKAGKSARIAVQWQGPAPTIERTIHVVVDGEARQVPVLVQTVPL